MKKTAFILVLLLLFQVSIPLLGNQAFGQTSGLEEIYINFQGSDMPVPRGYLADYGESYGEHEGFTYGWNKKHSNNGIYWASQEDEVLATGLLLKDGSIWEIQLYNGFYEVTVGVYSEEEREIGLTVEDKAFWDQTEIQEDEELEETHTIEVTDQKLTIYAETDETLISYLHIVPMSLIIEDDNEEEMDTIEDLEETNNEILELNVLEVEASEIEEKLQEEALAEEVDEVLEEQVNNEDVFNFDELPITDEGVVEVENPEANNESIEIILKMYNGNRAAENNTIFPWFQVINSGSHTINLENMKIRYYYTVDGEKEQRFFSDWSSIGNDKITAEFIKMEQPWEGADHYVEIGFVEGAESLPVGASMEIQSRIAKIDWSNYIQTNDYSFNQNATSYEVWDRVTVHYHNDLIWGVKGNEVEPEPLPTEPELALKMYNSNRSETSNTIFIRYLLENTGKLPVSLKDVKIQYFYTADGDQPQNYFADWSTIGASDVNGEFIMLDEPLIGADHLLQLTFQEAAGTLNPGEKIEIHSRIGKSDWSNFNQFNDYSFNPDADHYVPWNKVILLLNNEIIWGEGSAILPPPEEPVEPQDPIRVQMYNGNRSEINNTIFPWFRIYNAGTAPIELKDINIRYFFTIDGVRQLNYYVDWSNIGASNVLGKFSQFAKPRPGGDHYFEIGFKEGAGWLAPGEYAEVHTRVAKNDWSNFSQINDFSFNPGATGFVDWTKVNGYHQGFFVWGEADFFDIPEGLSAEATETTLNLQWDPVETASLYEIEVNGVVYDVDNETSYLHTGLSPGTKHIYRVRAKTATVTGGWSEPLEVYTIPGIPQGLQALSTSESVSLSWDPVPGALAYEVEIYGVPIDVGANLSYIHTDLNPNTQTVYRVRAKNESGTGQWSSIIAQSTLPATPTGLKGNATANSVTISWNSTPGATTYDLEIDGQVLEGLTQPSFYHGNLLPNEVHSYRVKARNQLGTSQWSQTITVQTLPEIPENLQGTATQNEIFILWDSVEGATGYDLQVDGEIIENITLTEYVHSNLIQNSKHTYRVRARNNLIVGQWSDPITKTTLLDGEIKLTAVPASTQITLSWNMVSGALGYDIEVDGVIIDNGLSTAFVHKNLEPNSSHTYRVRARSQGGPGAWSESVTATTIFGSPKNIQATATSDTISLFWQAVAGATGYDVFVDGKVIDNEGSTVFHHTELEPFSFHVYRVRAKKGQEIVGEWSEASTFATLIGTPGNIRTKTEGNQIRLDWDPVANVTHYDVEINGTTIKTSYSNRFIHEAIDLNKTYTYRIRAVREDDRLEWSSISDWSKSIKVNTLAGPPVNLKAEADTTEIRLIWDPIEGVSSYDVEIDGNIVEGITTAQYDAHGLKPNTYHQFRVRARYEEALSEWSEPLEQNTIPELTIQIPKDNLFHFVVVAPPKTDKNSFSITVIYDPEAVEVVDLSVNAPQIILETGPISGTQITVTDLSPGKIVYRVDGAVKTTVNSIQFLSLTNEDSKITYRIE